MTPRHSWLDQNDTPLISCRPRRPGYLTDFTRRPGYLTDFTRRPDPRKLRLGDWLPVLFVALALAVALALYALPTALGWIEGGL
jgi:hypothetical protein